MDENRPDVQTIMKAIQQANRALLLAMKRHEAAARVVVARGVELGEARRHLKTLLSAAQPELPDQGTLPS